jgi:hypothetical protein
MPSTDRKVELKAKTSVAQTDSRPCVYAKGLIHSAVTLATTHRRCILYTAIQKAQILHNSLISTIARLFHHLYFEASFNYEQRVQTVWYRTAHNSVYRLFGTELHIIQCTDCLVPPSRADCLKIWEPQPPGTLRACQGL